VVDFEKSEEILMVGNQAGERYRHAIDSLAALQESAHYRKPLVLNDVPVKIESIQIFGAKNYTTAYVKGKLKIRLGDEISRFELTKRMEYLAATENYNQIDYQLEMGELRIFLIEEEQKAHLKIGAHFDDLYQSAVLVTLDHKRLLIDNDELSVDFILGDRVRFNLNYFVDNGFYTSFGLKARYNHFRTNTSFSFDNSNANNTDLNYQDVTTELFAQTTFNRRFAVGLGAEWKHLRVTTENFNDQESFQRLTLDDSDYLSLNAFAKLDTYDDAWFPTRGVFADVGGKWYAWSSDYLDNFQPFIQIGGTIGFATTFWDRWTFQYTNDAGFTFGNPQSEVFDFYMGGYNQNYINTFVPLYGYEFAQVFNESFLRSEFLFRYRLAKNNYAVFIANYGRVAENVFVNTKDLFKDVLSGYALGYSLNTLIGPIEIKYSWSPENTKGAWLFNLGFWF
jgi:NTE family protein